MTGSLSRSDSHLFVTTKWIHRANKTCTREISNLFFAFHFLRLTSWKWSCRDQVWHNSHCNIILSHIDPTRSYRVTWWGFHNIYDNTNCFKTVQICCIKEFCSRKLKTHSPKYCIMDNWENMSNLTIELYRGKANFGGRYSIHVCDVYGTAAPSPAMTSKRKWPLECIVFNGTWRRRVTTLTMYKGKTYLYRPMYWEMIIA